MGKNGRFGCSGKAHTGVDRNSTTWAEPVGPTLAQKAAAIEHARAHNKIMKYDRLQIPNGEANMNRLLTLKRDLCSVPGCPRKHIYWTPNGKFCARHRDEATAAMAAFNRKKYGDA